MMERLGLRELLLINFASLMYELKFDSKFVLGDQIILSVVIYAVYFP